MQAMDQQTASKEDGVKVAVCICTYKRPLYLARLLEALAAQETGGEISCSVVVVDNDAKGTARQCVENYREHAAIEVTYGVETNRSIARARNKAVRLASGDFIAFIDDDEIPDRDWLLTLVRASKSWNCDGALGPVKPIYEVQPPRWVIRGEFYDRPSYPTGTFIHWRQGRTGNTLVRKEVFDGMEEPFNPVFATGEDQDFFRRAIAAGYRFVWCHEAMAHEFVPAIRWQRSFMLKRALLRGKISVHHPDGKIRDIAKSLLAVPLYGVSLPIVFFAGHHVFMKVLVKFCDHAGKLMACVGINPIDVEYVTE